MFRQRKKTQAANAHKLDQYQETVDSHHQKKLREFAKRRDRLRENRQELERVLGRLQEAEEASDWDVVGELRRQRNDLQRVIRNDRTIEEERDYFHSTVRLLDQYYQSKHGDAPQAAAESAPPQPQRASRRGGRGRAAVPPPGRKNILAIIDGTASEEKADEGEAPTAATTPSQRDGLTRREVVDAYLRMVDAKAGTHPNPAAEKNATTCQACDGELELDHNRSLITCRKCGASQVAVLDRPLDADAAHVIAAANTTGGLSYRRESHLLEHLANCQALEASDLDQEILARISDQIRREGIDPKKLSNSKMREVLKRMGLVKMYEHIPAIICHVSGRKPIRFTPEIEERLKQHFREIQTPFALYASHVVPNRSNFLSYQYTIHKLLQHMGETELAAQIPGRLKSREKMLAMEQVWQKICEHLGWKFIPSM